MRRSRSWPLISLLGVGLLVAGLLVVGIPLVQAWQRGRVDDQALQAWNSGGSDKLAGPQPTKWNST